MKKSIVIGRKKWFWVIVVVVALAALGNFLGLYEDDEDAKDISPQSPSKIQSADGEADKDKIATSVDALIDETLKGDGYFCEILTLTDGGYRVDIQLPANKDKPESTKIIEKVLGDVRNLQNDNIKEIKISILNQMKIVDEYWWPIDE